MRSKRVFDFAVCALGALIWFPTLLVCAFLVLITTGRPIFYISRRRVFQRTSVPIVKFRTMVTNAEAIANRDTIPVTHQRFLNIPPESPLYTPVGRFLERLYLTEIPQFLQVLRGQLSLIGNRPLPENVISAIREDFPDVEDRFSVMSGMTGPVQLVGRDNLSDRDRLSLEIAYCNVCRQNYSAFLDFVLLVYTVLIGVGLLHSFTPEQVKELMTRLATGRRRESHPRAALMRGDFVEGKNLPSLS